MRLTSFSIHNFRSIESITDISMDNLLVLIGRNNAGKSNVLKALDIFFDGSKPKPTDIPYFATENDTISISCTFSHTSRGFRRRLGITEEILTIEKQYPIVKDGAEKKVGTLKELINQMPIQEYKANFGGLRKLRDFLYSSIPRFFYVPALRSLADEGKLKRGSLLQELMLPLLDDEVVEDGEELLYHINEITRIINKRSLTIEQDLNAILNNRINDFKSVHLKLEEIDIKKALSPNITVKPVGTETEISALLQGAGTQNFIILALAQHYARGSTPMDLIIAFEEPEISLHSSAQRNMLNLIFEIIKNDNQQVMLTTHSTIFIDQTTKYVCLTKKEAGRTVVTKAEKAKEILSQLGVRGSDYLTTDAIVFVEGITDYEVYKLWAEAASPPSWKEYVITFLPVGGLSSMSHFSIEDCSQLCKHIYAIVDSDKEGISSPFKSITKEIVNKICNELGGHVKILEQRELENYFTIEAVKVVFPYGVAKIDPEKFNDPYAKMKEHLTEIIREDHYQRYHILDDYDETITERKYYSYYYAKEIAKQMVALNQIPRRFINILEEFGNDLRKKNQ
ncbi:MAG: ATP-dependent nuclease [Candidatus Hodarchaeales archaeon]